MIHVLIYKNGNRLEIKRDYGYLNSGCFYGLVDGVSSKIRFNNLLDCWITARERFHEFRYVPVDIMRIIDDERVRILLKNA